MKNDGKGKVPGDPEVILLEDLLPEEDPKGGRAGEGRKTTFGDRTLLSEIEDGEAESEEPNEDR
ncbi:MAG TPA: hypothetical protein VKA53_03845 [Thermoanaerobaculia bacterium]|nr:hypothetical protein [Thermoanaerobaculia bacterium]